MKYLLDSVMAQSLSGSLKKGGLEDRSSVLSPSLLVTRLKVSWNCLQLIYLPVGLIYLQHLGTSASLL